MIPFCQKYKNFAAACKWGRSQIVFKVFYYYNIQGILFLYGQMSISYHGPQIEKSYLKFFCKLANFLNMNECINQGFGAEHERGPEQQFSPGA